VKMSRLAGTAIVAVVAALALTACGGSGGSNGGGGGGGGGGSASLSGSGSTFQADMEQEWTAKFTNASVSYNPIGSASGQQQFAQGSVDFAGSDITLDPTLKSQVQKTCNGPAVTVPVTAGGIAVIYNLPSVSTLKLDADTVAKIFQGQITHWNDPEIKALNPGVNLPSTTISPYHRSDGSGTTSVLSAWLDNQAKGTWKLGTNSELNWPKGSGQAAEGSSGVTQGVQQTQGGITYAEQSYVKGGLKAAELKNPKGQFVASSPQTVSTSIGSGYSGNGANGGTLDFGKMTGYPVSTVSYIIACQKYSDSAKGTAVKGYLTYIVGQGQSYASQLGFAPLPQNVVSSDQQLISKIS
jgi:phosphate transport system substrate-binding protein